MFKRLIQRVVKRKTAEGQQDPVSTIAEQAGMTVRAFVPKEQGSKMHNADMLSDSKLSKAIRPVAIIWILSLFTAALVANWFGLRTDAQYQELIFWALLCVLGFYFPGRDLVKTFSNRKK
jgi:hypothetical protein